LFRKIKPERIFNLASHANVKVCFDNPIAVFQNNTTLMINLLEAVRLECPGTVFQQCSTSEVYGNPKDLPMYETHPMKPVNPYAVSKLAQEALAYAYFKSWGLKIIVTRMFAYINPRRHDLFATAFARQVVKLEKSGGVLRHGNLASIRTLIDVRDAMETYWIASEKCEPGEAYNIGGKDTLSVGDFLRQLLRHSKSKIETYQDPNLMRPVDVTNQVPNTDKFDNLTGWKQKYSLDDSIEFLLNHCRKEVR
jgi:GDPmannose 4,6-dehydratase/GDP-4-dehydro-6-deoxy-D-mannose reductase